MKRSPTRGLAVVLCAPFRPKRAGEEETEEQVRISIRTAVLGAALVMGGTFGEASRSHAALIIDYKAPNYNPTTGVWANDASLPTKSATFQAAAGGTKPTLATGATPNGSAAVNFTGSILDIAGGGVDLSTASGFTIMVFGYASNNASIVGRTTGSLVYLLRGADNKQQVHRASVNNYGSSTLLTPAAPEFASLSISGISGVANSGVYRLNGANAGTFSPSPAFAGATDKLGGNAYFGAYFQGRIAEIRIYDSVLTLSEKQAVEAQFIASYVPEPATAGLAVAAVGGLLVRRKRRT